MTFEELERLEAEIRRLRRRYAPWLRELAGARELPVRWTLAGDLLRWHIALGDIVEPDVDVEIARRVVIVRARQADPRGGLWQGLLPIPSDFASAPVEIRCEAGYLEIRVGRQPARGGRR